MLPPAPVETGYAIVVQPDQDRWVWALMDLDAVVTASGAAGDKDTAWSCGAFAAATIAALKRASRRRF
ncbi:MAG: hypothetical protein Q7U20_00415 [Caulobacter sp.]|nr:hypothetical protein [Caulobacter sp.]